MNFEDPDAENSESTAMAVDESSGNPSVPMTLDGLAEKLNAVILSDQAEADEEVDCATFCFQYNLSLYAGST